MEAIQHALKSYCAPDEREVVLERLEQEVGTLDGFPGWLVRGLVLWARDMVRHGPRKSSSSRKSHKQR